MDNAASHYRPMPNRNYNDWNRDWDLFEPFWKGTKEGRIYVQECMVTRKKVWPPRFLSPFEPNAGLRWVEVAGEGEVYTLTVVNRGFFPYYKDKVPYALVVVDLGDGVRMLGNSQNIDPHEIHCGMKMRAVFEDVNEKVTLVNWEPVNEE